MVTGNTPSPDEAFDESGVPDAHPLKTSSAADATAIAA